MSPAGGGIQAWIFTTTLATPADVIPPTGTIYPAIGVTMNANWTNDGLSVHMSAYAAGSQGDQPRTAYSFPPPTIDPNAPGLAFNLDRTNLNLLSQPRTSMHRIDLLTPGAVLNVGADVDPVFQPRSQGINPNFGIAGLYPDHLLRLDGLSFRFRDANSPNTNLGIVGSVGFAASPLNLSFFEGGICVNFPTLFSFLFAAGTTDAGGLFQTTAFPFPITGTGLMRIPSLSYQAATLPLAGKVKFSNGAGHDHPF